MPKPESKKNESAVPFSLPPLAQLGAVTGRFVHDLANEISSASTILTLIQDPDMAGAPPKEDLDELDAALQRAVTLIHTFGATVRALRPSPEAIPFEQLQPSFEALAQHHSAVTLNLDDSLSSAGSVICHPDWLMHCVEYGLSAVGHEPRTLSLTLTPAKSVTPPADYYAYDKPTHFLEINIYAQSAVPAETVTTPPEENLSYFVVKELLRHMRGFLLKQDSNNKAGYGIYLAIQKAGSAL